MGKYDDIINLPHHESSIHRPMPPENRAAQFAPFAALTGHEEAIAETARLTQRRILLSDDEKARIARRLNHAILHKSNVSIKYFCPDNNKEGGEYKTVKGKILKFDEWDNRLYLNPSSSASSTSTSSSFTSSTSISASTSSLPSWATSTISIHISHITEFTIT